MSTQKCIFTIAELKVQYARGDWWLAFHNAITTLEHTQRQLADAQRYIDHCEDHLGPVS